MDAVELGRSLGPGTGFSLLVSDVAGAHEFATAVLGAACLYRDTDFAAFRFAGSIWMAHRDGAYAKNPLSGILAGAETRGAGVELRLYGCDPDAAEARARELGFTVLAGSLDKPHGLRECIILDADGYAWVPGKAI